MSTRATGGFHAFVGNPPFLGGTRISVANGQPYKDWLCELADASGLTDLVAFFFRRAFELLADGGCAGLLATNSIAQGDTRHTGLQWICTHDGVIFDATKRLRWPGIAAVVVSVVHFRRGARSSRIVLDGIPVERISAFLFHQGGDEDPAMLKANQGISAIGSFVLGIGFVFDDQNPDATSTSEMERLIQQDERNRERIFAYLGGEELNSSPTVTARRYVIDFGEMSEAEARTWPELFAIVEAKVRPARQTVQQRDRRELWWLHATRSPEMRRYLIHNERCLALSQVSSHLAFAFVGRGVVVPHTTVAILLSSYGSFAVLQARPHELWARFFGSSLEDRLRYTPSDCFETFPLPAEWETSPVLKEVGSAYYDHRARLMEGAHEGLTSTYNRFNDPEDRSSEIVELRRLHHEMDCAVLDAYGWSDIRPTCTFLLEYEEEENDDGRSRKKKPWRYRWPDDVRDEVLARLLALNARRAADEKKLGEEAKLKSRALAAATRTQKRAKASKPDAGPKLPGVE